MSMIREPEFDGQVSQEIVKRRIEQCRIHRSEVQSVETSTATIIAILALYAAFFRTTSVSLADITDLGAWAIFAGILSWILSFILAMFLDLRLRHEVSTLMEMLDQHDHGRDLPGATHFFDRHPSNKFAIEAGLIQFLARISPLLIFDWSNGCVSRRCIYCCVLLSYSRALIGSSFYGIPFGSRTSV